MITRKEARQTIKDLKRLSAEADRAEVKAWNKAEKMEGISRRAGVNMDSALHDARAASQKRSVAETTLTVTYMAYHSAGLL
jgi:hypothetical protein